ncbi:hypothetical protein WJX75_000384 [Coccomyxa subellipsoidea]|uniref:Uncharacterized protein n=1 Tax=Coccomyxa subellipsoidea TaxID=248742 RepID=A0ABR2YES0_9CHLO
MKRGLLTPRGARAQEKPAAEGLVGKATGANLNIPKAPASTTDPVNKINDVDAVSKILIVGSEYVKATVEAKEDGPVPATVVLEPVRDMVSPELTGPATPALTPAEKTIPDTKEPLTLLPTETSSVAEKAEPDVVEDEGAPEEELGFEPPNVRVTVAGVPTEEPKAIVTLEANKEKGSSGGTKKAFVGVLLLAAASVVGLAVKGARTH